MWLMTEKTQCTSRHLCQLSSKLGKEMASFVLSANLLILLFSFISLPSRADTNIINSIKTETRIVGERKAAPDEFPYQVAIFAKETAVLRCGGALLAENFVLTSAYCANLGKASDIQVMVGNVKISRDAPSQLADVKRIFTHENYDLDGRKNDVALLQLIHSLLIRRPSIDVIALNESPVPEGDQCTFTGWGSDTWNGAGSDILEKVNLTIVKSADCITQLGPYIQGDKVCAAGKGGTNACFLDEGSPLVCGGKLTGILSHSVNCGKQNKPSVYTNVASHKDWIQQILSSGATHKSLRCCTILAMLAVLACLRSSKA